MVQTGDELAVTGEFQDERGKTWYLVAPPAASELWLHSSHLEKTESDKGIVPTPAVIAVVDDGSAEEQPPPPPPIDIDDLGDADTPEVTFEEPVEPEPVEEETPLVDAEILADVSLEDAENKWEEIRRSPQDESELEAMQLIYTAISERDTTSDDDRERAEMRIKQIGIQRQLQEGIDALQRIEKRNDVDKDRIETIREALLDRSDYTVIGRLRRSRIYDGGRLPLLFRLEDPGSGRTIAYVKPIEGMPLGEGVGRIVGIVGNEREDLNRRIKIVTPYRFEIDLTEETEDRK